MKKLLIVPIFLLASCTCTVHKKAVEQVEATHEIVSKEYLQYVATDPKLEAEQKKDRVALIDSLRVLILALKRSSK